MSFDGAAFDSTAVAAASVSVPTLTGPDTATEGTATQSTGDGLAGVTLKLTALKIAPLIGSYEKTQTIDDQNSITIDWTPETGQKEARDAAGFDPVNAVPMNATILATGTTVLQLKQEVS